MDVQIITKMFNAKYEKPVVDYFKNIRFKEKLELCQAAKWNVKNVYQEVLKLIWKENENAN